MTQQFTNEPAAQKDDWERALEGLVFPASHLYIIRSARDHGGLDTEVIHVLQRLPEQDYDTREELLESVRAVYAADGVKSPI